jgi:hypothetical protein
MSNSRNIAGLSAVEASADVTDTTNVTAAGALMDSEVTNLTQVKAFDTTDYATSTQGTTADNALPKAGGTITGELVTKYVVTALADAAATLTGAELIGGLFTITPTTPRILTTDTATNIVAALPTGNVDGSSFEFTVTNLAGFDVTFAGGTGVTIYGKTIVANGSASFRAVRLSATTIGLYRTEGSNNWSAAHRLRNSSQAIPTATTTLISLPTSVYDNLGEMVSGGRFTAKAAGIYSATMRVTGVWTAFDAGERWSTSIKKNGVTAATSGTVQAQVAMSLYPTAVAKTAVSLAVGDYIEGYFWHEQGADVNTNPDNNSVNFIVHRIA